MKPLTLALALLAASAAAQSPWAHLTPSGHLAYATDQRGDRIADFSYAGYMGGGVALPTNIPVFETLTPNPSPTADDSAALQAALDRTSKAAAQQHKTLALLLAPGTFHLAQTLNISSSSIVLRGSGSDKTILALTGKPHLGLHIGFSGHSANIDEDSPEETPSASSSSASTPLANTYIPSGTLDLPVATTRGFSLGDTILITRPITPQYVAFMGMDKLVRNNKPEHWIGSTLITERRIAAIHGNTFTLDVLLTDDFDPRFGGGSSTTVKKITPPQRLQQIGVEALAITCPPLTINLSDPHFDGIQIASTEDAWLRDLRFEDTTNSVSITSTSRRLTLTGIDILQRIPIQSPAKNFAFSLAGTQTLLTHCTAKGDKVFFVATQARMQGPNVVLDSTFTGNNAIEPHQRWSTGLLIDNVTVNGGGINFMNRGTMGSGHGWTIGWGVVWNSTAATLTIQAPPGSENFLIGSTGTRVALPMPTSGQPKGAPLPSGIDDNPNHPVAPRSLYLQQLQDRLGPQALHNIGY